MEIIDSVSNSSENQRTKASIEIEEEGIAFNSIVHQEGITKAKERAPADEWRQPRDEKENQNQTSGNKRWFTIKLLNVVNIYFNNI